MKDLERHDLISRTTTKKEDRSKAAALTEIAREVLDDLTPTRCALAKKVVSNLSPAETSNLIDMLERILGTLAETRQNHISAESPFPASQDRELTEESPAATRYRELVPAVLSTAD